MFAFIKRRQMTSRYCFALALVLLISYFSLAQKPREIALAPELRHSQAQRRQQSRIRAHRPTHSISLDSDNDGIPDTAELQSFMDRENFRQLVYADRRGSVLSV